MIFPLRFPSPHFDIFCQYCKFILTFARIFLHIFCGGGETMVVPEVQRVQKMEVYLMDNTKNTKNTKNTNTTDNTENTNTKNAKNAKNCK